VKITEFDALSFKIAAKGYTPIAYPILACCRGARWVDYSAFLFSANTLYTGMKGLCRGLKFLSPAARMKLGRPNVLR
jgi:gamma-glutamyl-gamma-aminobutyrate hydrolase PuuD